MVIFGDLKIEGFGCFAKSMGFSLGEPGLHIITGRNGTGKSTIFSALTWVIYGKGLKAKSDVETWEHKRPKNWQGTKVELEFTKDNTQYKVIRCKDYKQKVLGAVGKNRLFLLKGKDQIVDTKDKRELQAILETIVGYSYPLFTNTIVFPQKAKRFIEESGVDKKAILEEVFSLDWLTKALEVAKSQKNDVTNLLVKEEGKLKVLTNEVKSQEEFINYVKDSKVEFDKNKAERIKAIEEDIKAESVEYIEPDTLPIVIAINELTENLLSIELNDDYSGLSINREKYAKIFNERSNAESRVAEIQDLIRHYTNNSEHNPEKICDRCGQAIGTAKAQEILDDFTLEKQTLLNASLSLRSMEQSLKLKIEKGHKLTKEYKEIAEALNAKNQQLVEADKVVEKIKNRDRIVAKLKENLQKEIKTNYNDITPELLSKLDLKKGKVIEQEKKIKKVNLDLKTLQWIISTPLSNSGLKSYIISKLIRQLNQRLVHYEKFTNFGIELVIDEDLARKDLKTIVTKEGHPVLFEDISGGESQLVNISIAFALNDLVATTNGTNITLFDELFESLDMKNVEVVSDLLQDRIREDSSLYVITHKLDFSPRNSNIIKIEEYAKD